MIVALILLIGVIAAAAIAWPLVRVGSSGSPAAEAPSAPIDGLTDELERSLAAIKEIGFDHEAGNLSDEDFAELDASERARAVGIMREIDKVE